MLRKKLGIEAIERNWSYSKMISAYYFKIPSILTIPESCRKIGAAAFCGSLELKRVIIPKGVKEIGNYAFWNCSRAIIILRKLEREFKYVGYCAFDYCRDVKEETRD